MIISVGTSIVDTPINNGATATVAVDSDRHILRVTAPITNTDYLRVGPNAAAGRGGILWPGGFLDFPGSFAVSIHNESGAAQNYGYQTFEEA